MQTLNNWRTPPHDRAIGIEVECFIKDRAYYKALVENHESAYFGFFYAGTDVSITRPSRDYEAREFVSQPLTPEWLKRELKKLYSTFPIESNGSCGIHVHVSKGWLSNKKAEAVQKWIGTLSHDDFRHLFGRPPNRFCLQDPKERGRFRAVNITNTKTNEFRMFASGDCAWAQYCVDMSVYLVKNCYHLSLDGALAFRDLYRVK